MSLFSSGTISRAVFLTPMMSTPSGIRFYIVHGVDVPDNCPRTDFWSHPCLPSEAADQIILADEPLGSGATRSLDYGVGPEYVGSIVSPNWMCGVTVDNWNKHHVSVAFKGIPLIGSMSASDPIEYQKPASDRFPHKCSACGGKCYIGAFVVEHESGVCKHGQ